MQALQNVPAAIHQLVSPDGDCLVWQGRMDQDGCPVVSIGSRSRSPRRVALEAERGPLPSSLVVQPACGRRDCVNAAHLEPVTGRGRTLHSENFIAEHVRKTHCAHGHPLSGENLYRDPRGFRGCHTCRRAASKRLAPRRRQRRF